MVVIFDLGDGSGYKVPTKAAVRSQLVKGLLEDYKTGDATVPMPSQYKNIFRIYFESLKYTDISQMPDLIFDMGTLLLCFELETFLADDTFLNYLILQAYPLWDDFYPHIKELPARDDIYLHTPYDYLPERYRDNAEFWKKWFQLNVDKTITLNGNEEYHVDRSYYATDAEGNYYAADDPHIMTLSIYHLVDGVGEGWGVTWQYYRDGKIESMENRLNMIPNGLYQRWWPNGQLAVEGQKLDGAREGLWTSWWETGKLRSSVNYSGGLRAY